ncbi:MAG: hypothetical protein M1819_007486 [Sarea resinae]|nr:MAG: hypothetical protein M1819_007486 [Sarea resinae]
MNPFPRGPQRRDAGNDSGSRGKAQQGSVKRARAGVQNGMRSGPQHIQSAGFHQPESSHQYPVRVDVNGRVYQDRGNSGRLGQEPVRPGYSNPRGNPGAIGASISRPALVPLSPFGDENVSSQDQYIDPQRLLHPTQRLEYLPQATYGQDNSHASTNRVQRVTDYAPSTTSTRLSEASSVGTIPDFPVPATLQAPRRVPNTRPPPVARRGVSSYYSQGSFVSPIPEENPEARRWHGHGSIASSNVIPSSWGSGPPAYYSGPYAEEFAEEDDPADREVPRSPFSADHEDSTLVRQASVGKRHKPSLTTIKSSEKLSQDAKNSALKNASNENLSRKSSVSDLSKGSVGRAAVAAGATGGAIAAGLGASRAGKPSSTDALSLGTGLLDPSSSSETSSSGTRTQAHAKGQSTSNLPVDSRTEILGGLEKGGALDPPMSNTFGTQPLSFSSRVTNLRRPPRLNIDAVKEAEARGSLTSLPDLIRRATRLAAVLDRSRPASRLDQLYYDGDSNEKAFTRTRCSVPASDGCTTTDVSDSKSQIQNATVGSALPRLLQGAQANFSIPLDSSTLLSAFSASNLSCVSENALVTINGRSARLARSLPLLESQAAAPSETSTPTPTILQDKRDVSTTAASAATTSYVSPPLTAPSSHDPIATSDGIIFAGPSTTSASSSATPSATSTSLTDNDKALDFARVATLFVLQETSQLDTAISAQERMSTFLSAANGSSESTLLPNGWTIDFQAFQVRLGNGTVVGKNT